MRKFSTNVVLLVLVASHYLPLTGQTDSTKSEIEQLKSLAAAQQKALEHRQAQIDALRLSLAEQLQNKG